MRGRSDMRHEIITHRVGFPFNEPNMFKVLIAEGGVDDGMVLVEQPDGRTVVPDSDGTPQYINLNDCVFRQVGSGHTNFADAATVLLHIAEREKLIRMACWLAKEKGRTMTVEWYGEDVAHALSSGGFLRVEDLKRGVILTEAAERLARLP
jgi:hypothetical protein